MTRSRYKFYENEYSYFMTATINSWLPIFTRQESADIILDSWRHLQKERGLKLFAYVILENHLHMIASAPEISAVMQSFKSYTARQIIDLLKSRGSETLLRQLSATKLNHKTESTYQVWQEGSHPGVRLRTVIASHCWTSQQWHTLKLVPTLRESSRCRENSASGGRESSVPDRKRPDTASRSGEKSGL